MIRVYFCRGKEYIPLEEDLVTSLQEDEFIDMASVFKALANRAGQYSNFSIEQEFFLNQESLESLIGALNNLMDFEKAENKRLAMEKLNKIARRAIKNSSGLGFFPSRS